MRTLTSKIDGRLLDKFPDVIKEGTIRMMPGGINLYVTSAIPPDEVLIMDERNIARIVNIGTKQDKE